MVAPRGVSEIIGNSIREDVAADGSGKEKIVCLALPLSSGARLGPSVSANPSDGVADEVRGLCIASACTLLRFSSKLDNICVCLSVAWLIAVDTARDNK